jgi:alpha-galactosidase
MNIYHFAAWVIPCLALALSADGAPTTQSVALGSLDLSVIDQGYGRPQKDRSISQAPLSIGGQNFEHGVGTHAPSSMLIDLRGAERFTAMVGVDDGAGKKSAGVAFRIFADGKSLFGSGVMRLGDAPKRVDLDLRGMKQLELMVDPIGDSINYDHADWADAQFVFAGDAPIAIERPRVDEPAVRLTPPPAPTPRINGAKIFGVRPGSPFFFTIAATGTRPITFAAQDLPAGLTLDPKTGQITGTLHKPGTYDVTLIATNNLGEARRPFKIVCGDTLALTPPMGWNSWYIWFGNVTDKAIRDSADAMVSSGMINYGYQYVDIDDCWAIRADAEDELRRGEPRDAEGRINPNKHFPDMKALTDYIHSKGLKAGIYSSPGPLTCGRYTGSYEHEAQDAQQIADWGFDFFKYDWCSYGRIKPHPTLADAQEPYQKMGALLKQQKRDIVFNLCQYGGHDVWQWGKSVGGQTWRTAGDLGTNWRRIAPSMYRDCFDLYANKRLDKSAGPGAWNDPDYLLIGKLGLGGKIQPTTMTPNEQYTQLSFWALVAAPLFFGGDMTQLDDFTIGLLCNADVIDVDQDSLGQAAHRISQTGQTEIWARDLEDGSKAVGLFNRGEPETGVTVTWKSLGLSGAHDVRDLWRQKELGSFDNDFPCNVARHGVALLRVR